MTLQRQSVRVAVIVTWISVWSLDPLRAQAPEPAEVISAYTPSLAPDDPGAAKDPKLAESLFFEAATLHKRGQVAHACDKLQQSLALAPTIGTLLNLGRCHSELGRLVTAHDYYRRAEVLATLLGDTIRRDVAHDEAAELAPRRATLSLQIAEAEPSKLEVRIDDVPQPPEIWSKPMFIDAGLHSVSIRAPEHEPFLDHVRVEDGTRAVVVVPDLQRLPTAPLKAAEPASQPGSLVSPEMLAFHKASQAQHAGLGTARTAALVVGGAGVVSLAVGLLFGQLARNANEHSQSLCQPNTDVCSPQGLSLREDAFAHATRSTVLSIAGAVAIASGVTLWIASPAPDVPPGPALALSLSRSGLGAELRGAY